MTYNNYNYELEIEEAGTVKRFFDQDTPLFKIMSMLLELAENNVMFLLLSIPIVTMGTAYTSMLACCFDMEEEEGRFSLSFFLRTFRRILRPSLIIWMIGVVVEGLLLYNMMFWWANLSGGIRILCCGVYLVLFLWIGGVLQFLFAFLARTGEWKGFYLKNSMLLSAAKFPMVILIMLLTFSPLTILMMTGAVLLRVLPLILLFWFSCPTFVSTILLSRILKPLFPELFGEND